MKQKNFTLPFHPGKSWSGYLSKLVALVLLVGGLGATQSAWGQVFTSTSLTITASPTGTSSTATTYYGARPTNSSPKFSGAQLANTSNPIDPFNAAGTLTITAVANGINPRGVAITASNFYYRVYRQDNTTNIPTYTQVQLSQTSTTNTQNPTTFGYSTPIDLLTVVRNSGGGTYIVDIYYDESDIDNSDPSDPITHTGTDPNNGQSNPYSATFVVAAPAVTPSGSTTIWQSTSSTDWFLSSNWTNGVPTSNADATIPENTQGTNIIFPVLNDLTKNFRVRNLTLRGTTNSGRAQLTIQQAVLHVFGNIQQLSGGLVGTSRNNIGVLDSTRNSTLILLGADQFITGRLSVPDIIIRGSGIKSVANALLPTNVLSLQPSNPTSGVIVQSASAQTNSDGTTSYVFDTTTNSLINLATTGRIDNAAFGRETNTSYIKGILSAQGALVKGNTQSFGNIGLEFLPDHNASLVTVQRIIGDPLIGPTTPAPGTTPVPIKRQYSISGDVEGNDASNNVVFHYLNSAYELNSIQESNLTMFLTPTGAAPYTAEFGTLDEINKTVTRSALPSLANYYLTLGDKTNPLPVSLVAFNAVRSGANTLLSWTTASEENNKGFNVQVSADGVVYRTLAFVASKSPNSSNELNYKYTDVETGKAGTRYYRLEQVDMDGKLNYSPVRAVGFDGAAATAVALVAYPNPFGDTIGLTVEGATFTEGAASVKLVDMTGRTVIDQKMSLNGASLTLGDLSNLRSGLYLAKVTLPDGSVQTVRVQKQ